MVLHQVLDYCDLDYRDPCNTRIDKKTPSSLITGIFLLIIPRNTMPAIIKDWDFFITAPGTFSGPSYPDNQGLTVVIFLTTFIITSNVHGTILILGRHITKIQ